MAHEKPWKLVYKGKSRGSKGRRKQSNVHRSSQKSDQEKAAKCFTCGQAPHFGSSLGETGDALEPSLSDLFSKLCGATFV